MQLMSGRRGVQYGILTNVVGLYIEGLEKVVL